MKYFLNNNIKYMAERSSVIYIFFSWMSTLVWPLTLQCQKKKWTGMFVCLKACSLQLISILLFKTKNKWYTALRSRRLYSCLHDIKMIVLTRLFCLKCLKGNIIILNNSDSQQSKIFWVIFQALALMSSAHSYTVLNYWM